jgi:hypothetical protein
MLRYLMEMLKGEATAEVKDEKYVIYHIMLSAPLSPLNFLLCRQIVREHGEATARRGCGIVIDNNIVNITLPRYNGKL